mgnify:CR=1 FL=1
MIYNNAYRYSVPCYGASSILLSVRLFSKEISPSILCFRKPSIYVLLLRLGINVHNSTTQPGELYFYISWVLIFGILVARIKCFVRNKSMNFLQLTGIVSPLTSFLIFTITPKYLNFCASSPILSLFLICSFVLTLFRPGRYFVLSTLTFNPAFLHAIKRGFVFSCRIFIWSPNKSIS